MYLTVEMKQIKTYSFEKFELLLVELLLLNHAVTT